MNEPCVTEPMLHTLLAEAIGQAFAELLPGATVSSLPMTDPPDLLTGNDACVLAIAGPHSGTIAILSDTNTTKRLSQQIALQVMGECDSDPESSDSLTSLEESCIQELTNRLGAIFVVGLPPAESHDVTFPVFFHGHEVRMQWDQSVRVARTVHTDDLSLEVHVGIKVHGAAEGVGIDRFRSLDDLRQAFINEGGD